MKRKKQKPEKFELSAHQLEMLYDWIDRENKRGRVCFGFVTVTETHEWQCHWANSTIGDEFFELIQSGEFTATPVESEASPLRLKQ